MLLEHHPTVGAGTGHRLTVDEHAALGGAHEPGHRVEHGRLATARGPEQRHELSWLGAEAEALDGLDGVAVATERDANVIEVDAAGRRRLDHVSSFALRGRHGISEAPPTLMSALETMPRIPIVSMPTTIEEYFTMP